jgi:Trypsin-co-occurring domain 1
MTRPNERWKMTDRLVEVLLDSGGIAHVAAAVDGGGDAAAAGRTTEHFKEVIGSVTELTESVVQALRSSLRKASPSSIQLEVGVKFAVKSGKLVAFLAEASGEGSLVVTLGWDGGTPS